MKWLALLSLVFGAAAFSPAFAEVNLDPPVPVRTVPPKFPDQLRSTGTGGLVSVRCTVDERGNVVDPIVEKSTNQAFDRPALEAIRKWKFKPASRDGTPVALAVTIPIQFSIRED